MPSNMTVNYVGLVSILMFYIGIVLAGYYLARKNKRAHTEQGNGGNEQENMILAGRNIGMLVGTFTMTATWVGGGYINGTAEKVYSDGLLFAQAPWGYSLSLAVGGLLFANAMRKAGYVTMLDPFQLKYGSRVGGLLYIPALTGEIFWSSAILSALGTMISVILDINVTYAVIIAAGIGILATILGGLYLVAYTDVIQFSCIFFGLWFCLPFLLSSKEIKSISSTSSEWIGAGKWEWTNLGAWLDESLLLVFGGIPWQVYFQRVLSSKSTHNARKLSFYAAIGCMVMAVPPLLIGAAARSATWSNFNLSSVYYNSSTDTLEQKFVLPLTFVHILPTWLTFICMGTVTAAILSSADSSILSASSMFAYNIYKMVLRPKASDRELLWVIRISILVVGVVSTCLSLNTDSVYALWFLCSDLVYVILFPQLLAVVYVRCCNAYGSVTGLFLGILLRVLSGDPDVGLPVLIKYPWFVNNRQLFPFRTILMLLVLFSVVVFSKLTYLVFHRQWLDCRYDFLNIMVDRLSTINSTTMETITGPTLDTSTIHEDDISKDKVRMLTNFNTANMEVDPEGEIVELEALNCNNVETDEILSHRRSTSSLRR